MLTEILSRRILSLSLALLAKPSCDTTTRWLMPASNLLIRCYYNFCTSSSSFSLHSPSISCCRVGAGALLAPLAERPSPHTIGSGLSTYVECLWGPFCQSFFFCLPEFFFFSFNISVSFHHHRRHRPSAAFLRNFYLSVSFSSSFSLAVCHSSLCLRLADGRRSLSLFSLLYTFVCFAS